MNRNRRFIPNKIGTNRSIVGSNRTTPLERTVDRIVTIPANWCSTKTNDVYMAVNPNKSPPLDKVCMTKDYLTVDPRMVAYFLLKKKMHAHVLPTGFIVLSTKRLPAEGKWKLPQNLRYRKTIINDILTVLEGESKKELAQDDE